HESPERLDQACLSAPVTSSVAAAPPASAPISKAATKELKPRSPSASNARASPLPHRAALPGLCGRGQRSFVRSPLRRVEGRLWSSRNWPDTTKPPDLEI